jgi:TatD DNase family protein
MIFTDSHAHLYSEQFNEGRTEMVQRAIDAGVSRLFMPNIDSQSINGMLALKEEFPDNCFPMMGLHPCSIAENYKEELKIVEDWLSKEKFYAVGEIGIDLYWDRTFLAQQQKAFMQQVLWSYEYDLPIVIHCRDSFNEIYDCLQQVKSDKLKGIFHCFGGSLEQAQQIIDLGLYIGIGGVVTFKNGGLADVVKNLPLDKLVLETDAPYLTPAPFRGKRNESNYLTYVASKIATIQNIPIKTVAEITTQNTKDIFGV